MPCCEPIYHSFVNESVSNVPFNGNVPTVTIAYLVAGQWNISVATSVTMAGGIVTVDHGGSATGIIKIVQ